MNSSPQCITFLTINRCSNGKIPKELILLISSYIWNTIDNTNIRDAVRLWIKKRDITSRLNIYKCL